MFIGIPRVFLTNSVTDVIGFGVIDGSLTGPLTWKYAATSLPVPVPMRSPISGIWFNTQSTVSNGNMPTCMSSAPVPN